MFNSNVSGLAILSAAILRNDFALIILFVASSFSSF